MYGDKTIVTVPCLINGKHVTALVDTGAQVMVISQNLVKRLGLYMEWMDHGLQLQVKQDVILKLT